MGFEPTTTTLATWRSTPELLPQGYWFQYLESVVLKPVSWDSDMLSHASGQGKPLTRKKKMRTGG